MKWKTSNGDKMTGIEFLRDRRQSEMVRREKSAAAVQPCRQQSYSHPTNWRSAFRGGVSPRLNQSGLSSLLSNLIATPIKP